MISWLGPQDRKHNIIGRCAYLLSGRAAKLHTAPVWASTDCSRLDAPTSNTSNLPSLVPNTACLLPGANRAQRPYPASMVRKQAPDLGFQILTSLLEPERSSESSLDKATVLMSDRWPGDSRSCRRLTSSSLMCQTCGTADTACLVKLTTATLVLPETRKDAAALMAAERERVC